MQDVVAVVGQCDRLAIISVYQVTHAVALALNTAEGFGMLKPLGGITLGDLRAATQGLLDD